MLATEFQMEFEMYKNTLAPTVVINCYADCVYEVYVRSDIGTR